MAKVFDQQQRIVALEYAARLTEPGLSATSFLSNADVIYEWLTFQTGHTRLQPTPEHPRVFPAPAEEHLPDTTACTTP